MHPASLLPYVEHLVACFGPGRLLFGSDWPVVKLASTYAAWLNAARSLVDALRHAGARRAIFSDVARRTLWISHERLPPRHQDRAGHGRRIWHRASHRRFVPAARRPRLGGGPRRRLGRASGERDPRRRWTRRRRARGRDRRRSSRRPGAHGRPPRRAREQRGHRARGGPARHQRRRPRPPLLRQCPGGLSLRQGVRPGDARAGSGSVINMASIGGVVAVRTGSPTRPPSSPWSA